MENKKLNIYFTVLCIITSFFQLIVFISSIVGLIINREFLIAENRDGYLITYILSNMFIIAIFSYLSRYSFKKVMEIIEYEKLDIDKVLVVRSEKHFYLKFYTPFIVLKKLRKKYREEF